MSAVAMRVIVRGVVLLALASTAGCALLPSGSKARREHIYLIAPSAPPADTTVAPDCGSIQVAAGTSAPGHRGAAMVYTRDAYEIKYFAYSRWGGTPTRMLRDQARRYLRASGAFAGVLDAPVVTPTDYDLEITDTEVRQHFDDDTSTQHLGFEARLYDGERRYLLGSRRFVATEPAGDDPESGVMATNAAAGRLLNDLVSFVLSTCRDPSVANGDVEEGA